MSREEFEQQQVKIGEQVEEAAFHESLSQMGAVLNRHSLVSTTENITDPMLRALRIIGEFSKLEFLASRKPNAPMVEHLENICRRSKVRHRLINLHGVWWNNTNTPLLAFYGNEAVPVALINTTPTQYVMIDPRTHETYKVTEKIAQSLSPIAFCFYDAFEGKEVTWKNIVKLFFKDNIRNLVYAGVVGLLAVSLGLFTPYANRILFDIAIPDTDFILFTQIIMGITIITLSSFAFSITQSYILMRLQGLWVTRFQAALWDRLLRLPMKFFRQFGTGDLVQRLGVAGAIRDVVGGNVMRIIFSTLFAFVYLIPMFYYSWQLALAGLSVLLIGFLITLICALIRLPIQKQILEISGQINEAMIQMIAGITKLRVAGAEKRVFAYWAKRYSKNQRLSLKSAYIGNVAAISNTVLPVVSTGVVYTMMIQGMQRALASADPSSILTIGKFLAFNAAYGAFSGSFFQLLGTLLSIIAIQPQWERAKPILQEEMEADRTKVKTAKLKGELSIDHLFFRYNPNAPFVLYDVTIQCDPGEFVAIVGPSGCGKSTLVQTLVGFESPEKGGIYYDRHDLAGLDLQELRQQIGIVMQTSTIFSGTLYENIVCGRQCPPENVMQAVTLSQFSDDLAELPMGLHTVLTSGGGTLSGGQRQRLLLARALVTNPCILILDEATSSLDNATQDQVIANLNKLKMTRLVIAHRLTTIKQADKIYSMDRGRVEDCGTFDELASRPGIFSTLLKSQQL